jgi:hypothetical protein
MELKEKKRGLTMTKVDLDLINENLLKYIFVQRISLEIEPFTLKYNLTLILQQSEDEYAENFILYFYDVCELNLLNIGGGLIQFMHLNIIKNSDGLDRIKYHIEDLEDGKISFSFFKCEILDYQ